MIRKPIIVLMILCAAVALAGMEDIELISNPGPSSNVVVTAKGVNGWINSIGVDMPGGATGNVAIALSSSASGMDSRAVATTNDVSADVWIDPSDTASRRYAITDKDTFSMTVSNKAAVVKQYRAVIRVETAK